MTMRVLNAECWIRSSPTASSASCILHPPAMRILFAGIIARYPFGGVTWCSLMYLLGLRALGHEVFYIEDTGECVYDPVQNTRATDPGLRHHLHPQRARAVRPRRPVVVRQLRRQLPRPQRRRGPALRRRRRSVHQPLGRLVVLARRVRADPAQGVHRFGPGVHAAGDREGGAVVRASSSSGSTTCSRSARTSAPPASPIPTGAFTWHKTWQPVTIDDWRTDARAARPLHDRDDLADRELRRRRRQQGSGVREVHRPAVADAAALRARDQRTAAAAARSTAGTRWTRCRCRARPADYRDFIHGSKAEFGVAKHTYVANRSGWFSDRTECYLASGRPALVQDTGWTAHLPSGDGLLAFSTLDEAIAGIDRINARLRPRTRGAARARSPASTSTRTRRAPDSCLARTWRCAHENRAHRARSRRRFRRRNPARSRR